MVLYYLGFQAKIRAYGSGSPSPVGEARPLTVVTAVDSQDTFGSTSSFTPSPAKWKRRTGQCTSSQQQMRTSNVSSAVQAPHAAMGSPPRPRAPVVPFRH